jgi:hypothetical protein
MQMLKEKKNKINGKSETESRKEFCQDVFLRFGRAGTLRLLQSSWGITGKLGMTNGKLPLLQSITTRFVTKYKKSGEFHFSLFIQ